MQKKMTVIELFAGVGGFRIGLEKTNLYKVIWSNQYEPKTKMQHASMVYENVFGKEGHITKDIHLIPSSEIPDADLLVGGFPCQDYSVATTLKNSRGIEGKKGVLWWQIDRILREKIEKPKYLILENVDRILNSPASQRGRDFAIILKCLDDLGYAVEWKIINAADYGFPQRRRRLFLIGYHRCTKQYGEIKNNLKEWIIRNGILINSFPSTVLPDDELTIGIKSETILSISNSFNINKKNSPYLNTGGIIDGKIYTVKTKPMYKDKQLTLSDIIISEDVSEEFYIDNSDIKRWEYLKGPKKELRVSKDGYQYNYSEGGMKFPDDLTYPARTIITGEGGKSPSRFKHVIKTKKGYRRLTPIELERLNGFPDNHTKLDGISNTKRAFFMGNALVCGIVEKIGYELAKKKL